MANYSPNKVVDILLTLGECNRNYNVFPVIIYMLSYILIVAIQVFGK